MYSNIFQWKFFSVIIYYIMYRNIFQWKFFSVIIYYIMYSNIFQWKFFSVIIYYIMFRNIFQWKFFQLQIIFHKLYNLCKLNWRSILWLSVVLLLSCTSGKRERNTLTTSRELPSTQARRRTHFCVRKSLNILPYYQCPPKWRTYF